MSRYAPEPSLFTWRVCRLFRQVFDIAEKEEEVMQFSLQAEMATKTWEEKLAVEVTGVNRTCALLRCCAQLSTHSMPVSVNMRGC